MCAYPRVQNLNTEGDKCQIHKVVHQPIKRFRNPPVCVCVSLSVNGTLAFFSSVSQVPIPTDLNQARDDEPQSHQHCHTQIYITLPDIIMLHSYRQKYQMSIIKTF